MCWPHGGYGNVTEGLTSAMGRPLARQVWVEGARTPDDCYTALLGIQGDADATAAQFHLHGHYVACDCRCRATVCNAGRRECRFGTGGTKHGLRANCSAALAATDA